MKKIIISVMLLLINCVIFASGRIDTRIMQHPLVEYCELDTSSNCQEAFTVKLKNGHEIYFTDVKLNLTFNKWSGISHINDVQFSCTDFNPVSNEKRGHGYIRIKDICKATGTNYNDVFSILDNYNEFCRLLNSLPWTKDDSAEKLCIKYSEKHYVYLYRWSYDEAFEYANNFIEISE